MWTTKIVVVVVALNGHIRFMPAQIIVCIKRIGAVSEMAGDVVVVVNVSARAAMGHA